MLFDSQLLAAASGSVGGLTAAHNRGGKYFRARVTPVNPNTLRQRRLRAFLRVRVGQWLGTLTQAQRDAWDVYARNVPLPGPLGNTRNVGGLGMWIRTSVPRTQAGLSFVSNPPTIFDLGGFTPITDPSADASARSVRINFDQFDEWVTEIGAAMLVFVGRPQNPGVTFFKGPYRFSDTIDGDIGPPPAPPIDILSQYGFSAGQRIFYRVVVARADGRYSMSQQVSAIADP